MKERLVTLIGGGGFLGRYVAQELYRTGARIRIAQSRPRDAFFLKILGGLGQTQFIAADVTRPDTLARAIEGSDLVVNLAGTFGPRMQAVHVDGARNVAQAAASAGVQALVHLSAIGADPHSDSNYGRTKGEGERALREAFPNATILRPSVVFGREDAFVNRFAGMISLLPVVPVVRGTARFQPVYVTDVAQAVLAALTDPGAHGGKTYALGGPEVLSLAELHRWIAGALGRKVHFLELPDAIGGMLPMLPGSPISKDQWRMLQRDSVVDTDAEGLAALGVTPTPLPTVAPAWLVRFRRNGRFGSVGRTA